MFRYTTTQHLSQNRCWNFHQEVLASLSVQTNTSRFQTTS